MKLTTFILFVAIMQVSAAGYAQKVTLSENNTSLAKLFKKISQQTGYSFWVEGSMLNLTKPVTINVKNAELKDVLNQIFQEQPVDFELTDEMVKVIKKEKPSFFSQVLSQFAKIDVRGKVFDENGQPLPGATIRTKDSNQSTTTDKDGTFLLRGVDENSIVIVTFIGYQQQEIQAKESMMITLVTAATDLQEVIVNKGYYTEKKELSTGSVSKVAAAAIERQPISNPLLSLQGQMPGVIVTQQTGVPGGSVSLQIRGRNSLRTNGNEPLYIVDGIPFVSSPMGSTYSNLITTGGSPLNTINPLDIESIEILKDADATSIYGARGANGVVLITLKKGVAGKSKVDIDFYQGIGKVTNTLKLLNTDDYLAMRAEAFKNDGRSPGTTDYDINGTWSKTNRHLL